MIGTDSIEQMALITSFESMSNELLMEIFEYYDFYSLYYSFGSLNSRISNILYHCKLFVDSDQVKLTDFIDFIRHILPKSNVKNIRSLHASNPHQIGVLAYDKSLLDFTHIRSLSLENIQSNIVEDMVSRIHFARLERFSLDKCKDRYINTSSLFKHFFDSNRYQFLRTYKDAHSMVKDVKSVSLIEYVTLSGSYSGSSPSDFLNFLNRSPCLKYIQVQLYFAKQYSKPVFVSPTPCHDTLRHLNLELSGEVCMETLVYVLKCLPRIDHLKLKGELYGRPELADPIFWETFLNKYLVKLQRLFLDVHTFDKNQPVSPIWNSLLDKEKVIEQIEKSKYWSSHQWKATFVSGTSTQDPLYWARFKIV